MDSRFTSSFSEVPRLGVDLTESDTPIEFLLEVLLDLAPHLEKRAHLVVFLDKKYLPKTSTHAISFHTVEEIITMQDDPLFAVRRKKKSALALAMRMLQSKQLAGFVTGGNTGALIAFAKLHLSMLHTIERPALMTLLPAENHSLAVLDVGANLHCKAQHLLHFAYMGIAYQKNRGIAHPRVALLNNGIEENKGTPILKEAYHLLKNVPYFIGNIEGRDIFSGKIDVLITEGFTGNILLKTAEGMGTYVLDLLKERDPSLLSQLHPRLHYTEYPGAILSGIDAIVLKFHGNASKNSFIETLREAVTLIENNFIERMKRELSSFA